jgi:thymidylate kinase
MLVTLSGLDGAGKSTLAEALKANLEKNGTPAVVVHMNKQIGLYAYIRNLRDAFLRTLRSPRPDPNAAHVTGDGFSAKPGRAKAMLLEFRRRIIWNKELRRWVDLGDLATFLVYRLYVEKVRGQVLIMDRYFYDRITDIADGRRWHYFRWFSRMTPVPDVPVFVEVSPEEAFARKSEYSVDSMTRRRAIYQEVFSWVPGAIILCNDDRHRAADELQRLVTKRRSNPREPTLASER